MRIWLFISAISSSAAPKFGAMRLNKKFSSFKSQEKRYDERRKEEKLSVIFLFFFSPINVITNTDAKQQCENSKTTVWWIVGDDPMKETVEEVN